MGKASLKPKLLSAKAKLSNVTARYEAAVNASDSQVAAVRAQIESGKSEYYTCLNQMLMDSRKVSTTNHITEVADVKQANAMKSADAEQESYVTAKHLFDRDCRGASVSAKLNNSCGEIEGKLAEDAMLNMSS